MPHAVSPPLTSLPAHEPTCPFCRGNEHETPEATFTSHFASGEWRLRVVPNKYPAVSLTESASQLEHELRTREARAERLRLAQELLDDQDLIDGDESRFVQESMPAMGFHEVAPLRPRAPFGRPRTARTHVRRALAKRVRSGRGSVHGARCRLAPPAEGGAGCQDHNARDLH